MALPPSIDFGMVEINHLRTKTWETQKKFNIRSTKSERLRIGSEVDRWRPKFIGNVIQSRAYETLCPQYGQNLKSESVGWPHL